MIESAYLFFVDTEVVVSMFEWCIVIRCVRFWSYGIYPPCLLPL